MCGTTGIQMKNVRSALNPNKKCEVQLKSHGKMYGTTEFPPAAPKPAEPNIQSMGLSSVGRPQPAEQNIQSMGYRPSRKSGKKHAIQHD